MGKVIWVLFYIAFLPITCIRYSAILMSAVVEDILTINDCKTEVGDMESLMYVGYYIICGLLWPFVYLYAVLPLAIVYRIYAYFKMVAQLCKFQSLYNG